VNPRDRMIAITVLAAIMLVAGAFLLHQLYLVPLSEREESIRSAQQFLDKQNLRIAEVALQKTQLDEWRKMSLPGDVVLSRLDYQQLLTQLIKDSGIPTMNWEVKPVTSATVARPWVPESGLLRSGPKEPFLTPLSFTVSGHTDLPGLVRLLKQFYSKPLLHKIKSLSVARPRTGAGSAPKPGESSKTRDLEIQLDVEAIIVNGAGNRAELVPKELAAPRNLADPPRDYAVIDKKNIFYGLPPAPAALAEGPDPAQTIALTSIMRDENQHLHVTLCDRSDNTTWHLDPDGGIDTFQVKNKRGELRVQGEVTRVEDREFVFRVGEKHYAIHLGQTLQDALQKPLTPAKVKELSLTRAPENAGAQE
jgi:hypothetical protein